MSGHETTCIVPVWESKVLENPGIDYNPIAGIQIYDILKRIATSIPRNTPLYGVKERNCFVALNYEEELKELHNTAPLILNNSYGHYQLTTEIARATEPIFQPNLENLTCPSIVGSTFNLIMKCDKDKQDYFFHNIVLSGGNTSFYGYAKRFKFEMQKLHSDCEIIAPANRVKDIVNGGAIFTHLSPFWDSCIPRFGNSKLPMDIWSDSLFK